MGRGGFPGPVASLVSSLIPDTCPVARFLPVQPGVPSTSALLRFESAHTPAGGCWP